MSQKQPNNHDLLIRVEATMRSIEQTVTRLSRDIEKIDTKLDGFREEEVRLSERFKGHVEGHQAAERRTQRNMGILSTAISLLISFLSWVFSRG